MYGFEVVRIITYSFIVAIVTYVLYGSYRTLLVIIWYTFIFSSRVERLALLRTHWCDVVRC
jgi:hypothetical protein